MSRSLKSHQSAKPGTTIWLTMPAWIDALGGWEAFDLDPCAPFRSPIRTARRAYSWVFQDGLKEPWFGRVWLNPPFTTGVAVKWLRRMGDHGEGTALIPASTDTEAFHTQVRPRASALLFVRGRPHFHRLDGSRGKTNSGAPILLVAYGERDSDILHDCSLDGLFVPLRLSRGRLMMALDTTWGEAVASWLRSQDGPVSLAELYRAFASHPKARGRAHYQAKIRQVLQRGAGRRAGRGRWEARS